MLTVVTVDIVDSWKKVIAKKIEYDISTRVSNELGSGHLDRAKHAMGVSLKLSPPWFMFCFGTCIWSQYMDSDVQ